VASLGTLVADMKLQSAAFMRDMTAAANSVNSNTAQMKRSMREMESESRKSAAAMQSLTTGLVRFGAAVGVSFGVREIVNFGREVAKMTADLDDQAKSAGLSVVSLQAYRLAATESGAASGIADAAIRKYTRSLGEAKEGNRQTIEIFKALGMTARDIAGSPEASLPKVVAALNRIGDVAVRARIETALFSRSGQDVENVLQAWGKSSDELAKHFRSLGLIIENELAEKMEKAAVAQELAWQRIKVAAVPTILTISNLIANLLSNISGMPASIDQMTASLRAAQAQADRGRGTSAGASAQARADELSRRIIEQRNATLPFLASGSFQPDLGGGVSNKGWDDKELTKMLADFDKANRESGQNFIATWDKAFTARAEAAKKQISEEYVARGEALDQSTRQIEEAVKIQRDAQLEINRAYGEYLGQLEQAVTLSGLSREQQEEEIAVLRAIEIAGGKITEGQEDYVRATVRARQETELWRDVTDDLQRGFQNFFADFLETGTLNIGKLWDYIKSTFAQLLAWMAARAIAQPIIVPMVQGFASALGLSGAAAGATNYLGLGGSLASGAGGIGSLLGMGGAASTGFTGHGFDTFGTSSSGGGALGGLGSILGWAGAGALGGGLLASLAGGNSTGGMIGGALGGVGASMLGGTALGAMLGSWAGPLGIAAGGLLGSVFGNNTPSNFTAWSNFGPGYSQGTGLAGDKPNSATLGAAAQAGAAIAAAAKSLQDVGITLRQGIQRLEIGQRDQSRLVTASGQRINVGAAGDVQAAVVGTLNYLLGGASATDANAQKVLASYQAKGGITTDNLDQLLGDIDFAKSLADLAFTEKALTQSEQILKQVTEQFEAAITKAKELGLETSQIVAARDRAVKDLIDGFNNATQDAIDEMTNATLFAWNALQKAQEDRIAEAKALGADSALLERRAALERNAFLKSLNDQQRASLMGLVDLATELALRVADALSRALTGIDEQISAASRFGAEMRSLAQEYASAGASISAAQSGLLLGDASPLSPMAQYGEARTQLETARTSAAGGNLEALRNLPDAARAFLTQSRNVNASTAAYASDFSFAQGVLGDAQQLAGARGSTATSLADMADEQVKLLEAIRENVSAESPNADLLREQSAKLDLIAASSALAAASLGLGINVLDAPTLRAVLGEVVAGLSTVSQEATLQAALEASRAQIEALNKANADFQQIMAILDAGLTLATAPTITATLDRLRADLLAAAGGTDNSDVVAAIDTLRKSAADGLIETAEAQPVRDSLSVIADYINRLNSTVLLGADKTSNAIAGISTGTPGANDEALAAEAARIKAAQAAAELSVLSVAAISKIKTDIQAWAKAMGEASGQPVLDVIAGGGDLMAIQNALVKLRKATTNPKNTKFLDPIISYGASSLSAYEDAKRRADEAEAAAQSYGQTGASIFNTSVPGLQDINGSPGIPGSTLEAVTRAGSAEIVATLEDIKQEIVALRQDANSAPMRALM